MRTEDLPVIDCPKAPLARGRAHGEALRGTIADKVERWQAAIGKAYGRPAAAFLPVFLTVTDFRTAIAVHTPDLLEEVRGIAEGAGISEETAYALQLMDEEWWFGGFDGEGHCSSLAVAPAEGRDTIVGQTMDLPRWHDGAQAVLRLDDGDSETLVYTSAGLIGLMGVSGRGLGICVNTLAQLAYSPRGLPVSFAMRGALARKDAAAAADFLSRVPHASGQNFQVGDRNGIRTLECAAGGVAEIAIADGLSLHTNHPLANTRVAPNARLEGGSDSRTRLRSLHTDFSRGGPVNAETARRALSAQRKGGAVSIVPKGPARTDTKLGLMRQMTVGAVVYEIGKTVSLSVAAGPPSAESWWRLAVRG
ncbi:C45 family peptidase [Shinella sp. JR1-6]|uniref:C45 family autoproteolytic acyltransferase/hydolase n=1 Tax=Shinella sp. JR1-6 TaxID=2527671 RepID=UPI00102D5462|nr:C45 family peptidase [Shinella sp. JR1-6]TAA52551.1 peptidase C45 [Shinella sp. JR1-6]